MQKHTPFHERLKYERERQSWSQADIAEKLGCDTKTVGRWERGEVLPRPFHRLKLRELFGKSAEELGMMEDTEGDNLSPIDGEEDWGEAPFVPNCYGREHVRIELEKWIQEQHCRVIAVLGMGGVGKTTLATYVAQQVKTSFPFIFWRSLHNAPAVKHIVKQCLFLVSQQQVYVPDDLDEQISLLIRYLRGSRCLIILDNIESILQPGERAGQYEKGCEGYGRLIQRIGETQHQSCLLLTSREKPTDVAHLEGKRSPVRSLVLSGVGQGAGRALLQDKELVGSDEQWAALVELYGGNPLALKLAAEPIQAVFGREIGAFLKEEKTTIGDITVLLEQQFSRLSPREQDILYWLAIEREAVSLEELRANLVHPLDQEEVADGLASLSRRSMIEARDATSFTLQPVIMEYVTRHLVTKACNEFSAEKETAVGDGVWGNYAFIKAQIKDYVRDSQIRFILTPILRYLLDRYGKLGFEQGLKNMLIAQQRRHPLQRNYIAGNVLNLLTYIGSDLRGADFSRLMIWQAYLQNVPLPEVNFAYAYFEASTFTNTFGNVLSVAFSPPDPTSRLSGRLAAGTAGGDIWVYEAQTGTPLQVYQGHSDAVWSLAFCPDGHLLASSGDDQTICLWDTTTGQHNALRPYAVLRDHTNRVRSVTFHPNGRLLASGSDDFTVRLWDAYTGSSLKVLKGHADRVWAVAFSPDGRLLASGSTDQSVRVWDSNTGDCLAVLKGHTDWVRAVAFSADGGMLASGSHDRTICVWDVQTGQIVQVLSGHTNRVWSVRFNTEGETLASSSEDRTIRVWDSRTGRCLKILSGHAHGVRSISFSPAQAPFPSPENKFVSARRVSIGGLGNGEHAIPTLLASGGDDQTVRIWDTATGYCLKTLQGYTNRIWSVAFHADEYVLASSSEDQAIRLWNVDDGACFRTLQDRRHGVRTIALSPDKRILASGGEDQTVRVWDMTTGDCINTLSGHTNWVRAVAFNVDGSLLASGSEDNTVRIWNVATGSCLTVLQYPACLVRSVVFSPDGSLLAIGGDDQVIRLWEVATNTCLRTLDEHSGHIRSVAFSPDGHVIASGSEDKTLRLWSVDTGNRLTILQGHTHWVRSVAFSPDGRFLASSSDDQTVHLWDIVNMDHEKGPLHVLQGHTNRVRWVTFSPDGKSLASSSDDGTIKLWDIHTATCLKTLINEKPYEHMNILQAQGLTPAQRATLRALGAVEER